ncbi:MULTISPECIES: hypothetical protein [Acinetobacter]|uniref:MarR family transcriptional regulator n=1 Tax=Acinetobacter wuhouensis TaxID=1879050 RepID=A0A3G2T1P7_9GAMM|nr:MULTISPECIES: hypothetical protein [Acinetobacter]AYO54163.1 hypothetical protein CDG68_11175 [Acinetobacter wuhouensis]RZG48104.1 hypothetical protein EXU28_04880 [Acinetobacter wuhouensis]RZG71843.1 hypothetical protein EXE09_17985 [Acinetobacter sp. WCHAc060025]
MDSAKDFQKEVAKKNFENAKNKVIKVLENEPFGLSVSQLMTASRLSVKTVKAILQCAEFKTENEVYFLKVQQVA